MKAKQLAIDAILAAMVAVLGYVSIDAWVFKITLESLPLLIGALLLGPADGLLIAAVGTFISQLLLYGISATTVLWMLPYMLCGLLVGFLAKRKGYELSRRDMIVYSVIGEFLITLLNTGVIYADSKIYGYYYPAIITGNLAVRLGIFAIKALAFALVIPPLIKALKKVIR